MNTNLSRLASTMLTLAFLLAISTTVFCQDKTFPIAQIAAKSMFTTGKAAELRNHLVSKLGAKIGNIETAEKREIKQNGIMVIAVSFVSQLVTYKNESVNQITIKITEKGITQDFDFLQYPNGNLAILDGTSNLKVYSLSGALGTCFSELDASCAPCRDKLSTCLNQNRIYKIFQCFLNNWSGQCLECGVEFATIWACILRNR